MAERKMSTNWRTCCKFPTPRMSVFLLASQRCLLPMKRNTSASHQRTRARFMSSSSRKTSLSRSTIFMMLLHSQTFLATVILYTYVLSSECVCARLPIDLARHTDICVFSRRHFAFPIACFNKQIPRLLFFWLISLQRLGWRRAPLGRGTACGNRNWLQPFPKLLEARSARRRMHHKARNAVNVTAFFKCF